MLAAPPKTLIAALGALAGLAAIAVTPVSALGDVPPAQSAQVADARKAAAALIAGPHDRDMDQDMRRNRRPDVDPASGRSIEAQPFNVTGEIEKPSAATVTAGTDNAQRLVRRLVKREVKRTVKRRIKRRNKSRRRARRLARRRY